MKRIGIIGAMEEEVALLKEQMQIEKRVEKASMEFCAGKLNGQGPWWCAAASVRSTPVSALRFWWISLRWMR